MNIHKSYCFDPCHGPLLVKGESELGSFVATMRGVVNYVEGSCAHMVAPQILFVYEHQ